MKKLADKILEQNHTHQELYERIGFMKGLVERFCVCVGDGDEGQWQEYVARLMARSSDIEDEELQTINLLSDSFTHIMTHLQSTPRHPSHL